MKDHLDFSVKISILQDDTLQIVESFTIARSELHYRAEGNANIVLSLPRQHKVLRLPKYEQTLYPEERMKLSSSTLYLSSHLNVFSICFSNTVYRLPNDRSIK